MNNFFKQFLAVTSETNRLQQSKNQKKLRTTAEILSVIAVPPLSNYQFFYNYMYRQFDL